MKPIVIIGTGLAGYTLAREFRKLNQERELLIITRDDGASYSKPMLSNAFAQNKTPESLILADAEKMAAQLNAEIRSAREVTRIDPGSCTLDMGHKTKTFGHLVLALGADPFRLPLEGEGAEDVLSVNDREDYARFRKAVQGKQHVCIIGAGLIGCEFANDLLSAGYKVSAIDLAPQPLGRLVPEVVGTSIKQVLAEEGVDWHLDCSVSRVDRNDDGYKVSLSDGTVIKTDVVLSAIGLRPRTTLAKQAGISVDRGIVVDRELRTSSPYIYALGDCAQVEGQVLPFVMPIMHAARALAKTLNGEPTEVSYPAMPVVVKTPAYPLVVSPPARGVEGEWQIEQDGHNIAAKFIGNNGSLEGFVLTGDRTKDKQALTKELPAVLA